MPGNQLRCASASMSIHVALPCAQRAAAYLRPDGDPVSAALNAIAAGHGDGITAPQREDRRHIRDDDMARLKAEISGPLNFEG